ncbi:Glutaredoxin domain-containing cysteine-rich protein [Acromyrmex echinatior]|uniref:Glutaredoxin domain-containing cysteine-rich protein n=1 Tax=Acromyrmex echinatior TaxID=103372 RepID=F4WJW6_ACREC|nr:Glutaredoxin domain-containing cysteine-rich protein [Acromyrmex echinatior]
MYEDAQKFVPQYSFIITYDAKLDILLGHLARVYVTILVLPPSRRCAIMIEGNYYTCHLRRVTGIGRNKSRTWYDKSGFPVEIRSLAVVSSEHVRVPLKSEFDTLQGFLAYVEREKGKVVLYTTSLGIVRETFTNCMKMKQMLWTNMVKYDEADLFRDTELQTELRDRTNSEVVTLPQLFVDGQYIGTRDYKMSTKHLRNVASLAFTSVSYILHGKNDLANGVDTVERLNESGELRRILEPYQFLTSNVEIKCKDACAVCTYCGGFQRLLCPICHGSKRSVHRNEFTVEFVALKCAKCDVFGATRVYFMLCFKQRIYTKRIQTLTHCVAALSHVDKVDDKIGNIAGLIVLHSVPELVPQQTNVPNND